MKDWFVMGGSLFMGILTVLFVIMLAVSVYFLVVILSGRSSGKTHLAHRLGYIKSIGLFTMITGILGQLIGLFSAFKAIEAAADISPAIMAGGLKVSMITTLTGIFMYLVSIILWFVLDLLHHRRQES
jgi:hypothetical protein